MKLKYDTSAHCKYSLQYHIIWCPKFRFSVLNGPVADVLKDILISLCETYHYEIKALEVMPDHIHIFLSAPQTVAPCDIARTLKVVPLSRCLQRIRNLNPFTRDAASCGAVDIT